MLRAILKPQSQSWIYPVCLGARLAAPTNPLIFLNLSESSGGHQQRSNTTQSFQQPEKPHQVRRSLGISRVEAKLYGSLKLSPLLNYVALLVRELSKVV